MIRLDRFVAPFYVLPLPLNKEGRGPEMDPLKVVTTVYQVWDANCATVKEFNSQSDANIFAADCNELTKK